MKISYSQDEPLVAAVAGTTGTASARRMVEVVLSHASQRRLITANWCAVEICPNFTANWSDVRPLMFAVTSWARHGFVRTSGLEMRAVCRVVASGLPAHGLLVLNGDDGSLSKIRWGTAAATVLVGQGAHCDLVARRVCWVPGGLAFELAGQEFCVPALRHEDLAGVLAAAAVGRRLQMSWAEIAHALAENSPPPPCQAGRMEAVGRSFVEGRHSIMAKQVALVDEELGACRRLPLARAA